MNFDAEELKQFLKDRANATWNESQQPYYLSMVQPDLAKNKKDYKSVVGEQTLRQFASDVEGLEVVRHPKHGAKIGLVPSGSDFSFEDEPQIKLQGRTPREVSARPPRNERIVSDFLVLMSKLDENDLEGFSFPAIVIAKMLRV